MLNPRAFINYLENKYTFLKNSGIVWYHTKVNIGSRAIRPHINGFEMYLG